MDNVVVRLCVVFGIESDKIGFRARFGNVCQYSLNAGKKTAIVTICGNELVLTNVPKFAIELIAEQFPEYNLIL